jgi:polysaccharide export outer membrane protein
MSLFQPCFRGPEPSRHLLPILIGMISLVFATIPTWAADSSYRVGPKDLLEIEVLEAKEVSGKLRVSENGTIAIPIVGEVAVVGLTPREIEDRLRILLETELLQAGQSNVSVRILEYRSRPINVIGAVKTPGPLDLSGNWSLLEALTAAGGLLGDHGRFLFVTRTSDNGLSSQIEIPIQPLLYEGDRRFNIPILAGDMINVPAAREMRINVLGEVEAAGSYLFKSTERITLLAAIAEAGGLKERAARKIRIKRRTSSGTLEEIVVDYKLLISGKRVDPVLEDGDTINVDSSFF